MKLNILSIVRKFNQILQFVSSPLAVWWNTRLFLSPRTTQRLVPDVPRLDESWCDYTKINGQASKARVYTAGSGPTVLLLHGWEGASYSHSVLARRLLEEGFRVIMFDMPAHGMSPGKITNMLEISEVAEKLATKEGGLHALVGHSFGATCAGYAIGQGLQTKYFVAIAAPSTIGFIIDHFSALVGASEKTKQGLIKKISTILNGPIEQASLMRLAPKFTAEGLIIHDRNDRIVPYKLAQALSDAWPSAELITTRGLGHSRILQSDEAIDAVLAKINSA